MSTKKNKEKKKVFPLSLTPGVIEKIDLIADRNSRSRSSQAEVAFLEFINKYENANPS